MMLLSGMYYIEQYKGDPLPKAFLDKTFPSQKEAIFFLGRHGYYLASDYTSLYKKRTDTETLRCKLRIKLDWR